MRNAARVERSGPPWSHGAHEREETRKDTRSPDRLKARRMITLYTHFVIELVCSHPHCGWMITKFLVTPVKCAINARRLRYSAPRSSTRLSLKDGTGSRYCFKEGCLAAGNRSLKDTNESANRRWTPVYA